MKKRVKICKPQHENYTCNGIFILLHWVLENYILSGLHFKIYNISEMFSAFFFTQRQSIGKMNDRLANNKHFCFTTLNLFV